MKHDPILILGNDRQAFSIAVCLLQAGHRITVLTNEKEQALNTIRRHLADREKRSAIPINPSRLNIVDRIDKVQPYNLGIGITPELLEEKRACIATLESHLAGGAPLLVNSESFPLDVIRKDAREPSRIIAANWAEPAHTTLFLEIICDGTTDREVTDDLKHIASASWRKDPYTVQHTGIRSMLMAALVREACYLVGNAFCTEEDIDRACRNDAGYYLAFAGILRYMDLMGTMAYGLVMKELNPELSRERELPSSFFDLAARGRTGMDYRRGFFEYSEKEVAEWHRRCASFSYDIENIIRKYNLSRTPGALKDSIINVEDR